MNRRIRAKTWTLLLLSLAAVLMLAVACGDDATSTPLPTSTPAATPVPPTPTPTEPGAPPTATATAAPTATSTPRPVPTATSTPAPVPTATPGFFTSRIDQLVIAMPASGYDTNVPWRTAKINNELDIMYETVVALARNGESYEARLSTEWEMAPGAAQWTFKLREDVPWHFGWGDFTAADVVHSWERLTSEESIGADVSVWTGVVSSAEDFEIVNDHEIVFNLSRPEPDLEFHLSTLLGNYLIVSKAQWDAEGEQGMVDRPSGTGPYQFKERELGFALITERVEGHWRQTPAFRELKQAQVLEDATRLAMLLTKEAHIVSLPIDLHDEAEERGYVVVQSRLPQLPGIMFFGGLHPLTPEKYDADAPLADVRVREALNRAIDRELINETIYAGKGKLAYFHYNHPSQIGWDPEFATLGPELYAYDPDRARELLIEAGYDDGFEIGLHVIPWGSMAEWDDMALAVSQMWITELGLDVKILEEDYSRYRPNIIDKNLAGQMHGWPAGPPRPPSAGFNIMYGKDAPFSSYESATFDPLMEELKQTADPQRRHDIQVTLGRELLTQYTTVPVIALPVMALVDPEVVADYDFPGPYYGYSHLEYVEAAN